MSFSRTRLLVLPGLALVVGGLVALACGGDDTVTPTTPVKDSGPAADTSTITADTSTGDTDAGGDAAEPSLYDALGGHDGIKALVHDVVGKETTDPVISTYFVFIGKPGHPASAADVEECFVDLVGSATGGMELYSTATAPVKTASGFTCRDMKTAHTGLKIPNGVFNDFVGIIAATASAAPYNVSAANLMKVAGALNATKGDIVDPSVTVDGGPFVPPDAGPADAATGG